MAMSCPNPVALRQGKGGSLAPATLEDARFDEGGNALPRVFVPRVVVDDPAAALVDGARVPTPSQVCTRGESSGAVNARFLRSLYSDRDAFHHIIGVTHEVETD